jgi:hypothetical protein
MADSCGQYLPTGFANYPPPSAFHASAKVAILSDSLFLTF